MSNQNQEMYKAERGHNYLLNFPSLNLTMYEIPKCGSSSVKKYLLSLNRKSPHPLQFGLGHANWRYLFPEAVVHDLKDINPNGKKLIIIRDPVSRIKSGYGHIYSNLMKEKLPISGFFESFYHEALSSARNNVPRNHFKPQHWFFPAKLLDDPETLFWPTSKLAELPDALSEFCGCGRYKEMPRINETRKAFGEIDMTDTEIRSALIPTCEQDFDAYEKAMTSATNWENQ